MRSPRSQLSRPPLGSARLFDVIEYWDTQIAQLEIRANSAYVYDVDAIRKGYQSLRELLGCQLLLSLKACPDAHIATALASAETAFDVSSQGELDLLTTCSTNLGTSSVVGPSKSETFLRSAIDAGIGQIVVESLRELEILHRIGVPDAVRLLLRINPTTFGTQWNEQMGGTPSQFGIESRSVGLAFATAARIGLRFSGVHLYLGSQIHAVDDIRANGIRAIEVAGECAERYGLDVERLCVGGGFGIAQSNSVDPLKPARLETTFRELISEARLRFGADVEVQAEVGRYVFGQAGVFVTTVIDVKESWGESFIVVSDGVGGFTRPQLVWGEPHHAWLVGRAREVGQRRFAVVGTTCLPGDRIGSVDLADAPAVGQLVCIASAGAYGESMSLADWGSRGRSEVHYLGR